MRDCPACRVPLHGYEEVCPSCGAKQYPVREAGSRQPYGTAFKPEPPKVNMVPFIVAFIAFGVFIMCAMNSTWIGQLARAPKQEEDPIAKMTTMQARDALETQLLSGLTAVGASSPKLTWTVSGSGSGKPEERSYDGPVELTVDTSFSQPEQRKQVVEPIKPLMAQAKLFTLNINDAKRRAHWTWNVQTPTSTPDDSSSE
jgi:hypothetical protein